jgi:hypothetical protein
MNDKFKKLKFLRFDIENKKLSLFGLIGTGGDLLLFYSSDYATELAVLFPFEEHA